MNKRLLLRLLAVALLALPLLWLLYVGVLVADVRRSAAALAALAAAPDLASLRAARPQLVDLRASTAALRDALAPAAPLAPLLGRLPRYGQLLAKAPALAAAAADLSAALDTAAAAIEPVIAAPAPNLAALTAQLVAVRPSLIAARSQLAAAPRMSVEMDALPSEDAAALQRAALLAPALADSLTLAIAAPSILGGDGRRTYLVAAQNPDELRATGGFLTAAGHITLDGGRIVAFTIADSALVDRVGSQPYPLAPEPMRRIMAAQQGDPLLLVFRDANWSPDGPAAAATMRRLYTLGTGVPLDGAIIADPQAVASLLTISGPVIVPGGQPPVTAQTIGQFLRDGWSAPDHPTGAGGRKKFLQPLAEAILAQLQRPSAPPATIAATLLAALDDGHLIVDLPDTPAAAVIAAHGWDAAVQPGSADFLMPIDTNMGYNKVNPNIRRSVSYAVDLSDPSRPRAAAQIRYQHLASGQASCDQWRKQFARAAPRYEDRADDCYWNYLRLLVPPSASLTDAETVQTPAEWMLSGVADTGSVTSQPSDGGALSFETLVVVPRGGQRQVTFRYALPAIARAADGGYRYTLRLQRQPGQRDDTTVKLLLPPGSALGATSLPPSSSDGQIVSFAIPPRRITELIVEFATP